MSVTPILVKPQKFGQKQGKEKAPVEEWRVEVRAGQKETLREGEEVANWERETLPCPEGDNGVITR